MTSTLYLETLQRFRSEHRGWARFWKWYAIWCAFVGALCSLGGANGYLQLLAVVCIVGALLTSRFHKRKIAYYDTLIEREEKRCHPEGLSSWPPPP